MNSSIVDRFAIAIALAITSVACAAEEADDGADVDHGDLGPTMPDVDAEHAMLRLKVNSALFVEVGQDAGRFHYQLIAQAQFPSPCVAPAGGDELAFIDSDDLTSVELFQLTDRFSTCKLENNPVMRSIVVHDISSNLEMMKSPFESINGVAVATAEGVTPDVTAGLALLEVKVQSAQFVHRGQDASGRFQYQVVAQGRFHSPCVAPASGDDLAVVVSDDFKSIALYQFTDRLRDCKLENDPVTRTIGVQNASSNIELTKPSVDAVNGVPVENRQKEDKP